MSIPLYGCLAEGPNIITMDDQSVQKDLAAENGTGGNTYAPFIVSTSFDNGLDGGYSHFRKHIQHVHADGAVTVTQTPYRDELEAGSGISDTLSTSSSFIVDARLSQHGTNFRIKIALSVFNAAVELGKALQYVVPRRSSR